MAKSTEGCDALVQDPSFQVMVWVSGGTGSGLSGGVAVHEAVEVKSAPCKDTLAAIMGADAATVKARWLAHCTRVGIDTIECIVRGRSLLPDMITVDPPPGIAKLMSDHSAPPSGKAYKILVEGAGGARGSLCNGTYREADSHNGKPRFVQESGGGQATIYFSNFWKMNHQRSTSGWIYGVDSFEGKGPFPPTAWRDDGYTGNDCRPFPTLKFIASTASCTPGSASGNTSLLLKLFDELPQASAFFRLDKKSQDWLQFFRDRCAAGDTASTPAVTSPLSQRASLSPAPNQHRTPLRADGEEGEEREHEMSGAYGEDTPAGKGGDAGEGLPFECYMAMATLLSFKSDLIPSKVAVGNELRKSDIDEALKRASLAEVKTSLRILRAHLEVVSASSLAPSPASNPTPTPSGLSFSPGTTASTAVAASVRAAREEQVEGGEELKGTEGGREVAAKPAARQSSAKSPALDDVALLSNLSHTVTRLSLIMSHLLGTLPLSSLLVAAEASSEAGNSSAAASGSDNGSGAHVTSSWEGSSEGNVESESRSSMRQLLSVGAQLMLREHKQPLVDKLFSTMPIASSGCPHVTLDRFKAMGRPGGKNENTMLAQLRGQMNEGARKGLSGDRWWRVQYVGEDGQDAGGLFRDSLSALAAECQRGAENFPCPLFVQMDLFQVDRTGSKQLAASYLVPNPACDFTEAEKLYEFVGQLMGACSRSSSEKLPLALAPLIWRMILGLELRWEDIAELEPELDTHVRKIGAAAAPNGSSSSLSWVELQQLIEHLDDPATSRHDIDAFWQPVCSNLISDDNVPDLVRDRVCSCLHLSPLSSSSHARCLRSILGLAKPP